MPEEASLPLHDTGGTGSIGEGGAPVEVPNALFVFGGMDMQGAMFEDAMLFRP
jgi:hypothetical protein